MSRKPFAESRKAFRDPRPAPVKDVLDDFLTAEPVPFDFSFPPTAYEVMVAEHEQALLNRHRFTRASIGLNHQDKMALHLLLFPKEN